VQILGALVAFLIGSYLADYIGRKGTFVWLAIASFVMVLVFLLVPMDNTALFWLAMPLHNLIESRAGKERRRQFLGGTGFRPRGQWPGRRGTEQSDEVTPFHCGETARPIPRCPGH
jgi:MFS family permease